MRRFQTLLALASICFLINSCAQTHAAQDSPATGGKCGSCCMGLLENVAIGVEK